MRLLRNGACFGRRLLSFRTRTTPVRKMPRQCTSTAQKQLQARLSSSWQRNWHSSLGDALEVGKASSIASAAKRLTKRALLLAVPTKQTSLYRLRCPAGSRGQRAWALWVHWPMAMRLAARRSQRRGTGLGQMMTQQLQNDGRHRQLQCPAQKQKIAARSLLAQRLK